jgi:hypothetical protein
MYMPDLQTTGPMHRKFICPIIIVGVFLIHAITRFDVLFLPPYWDSLQGPFIEALWLKENGFDYWRLIHHEPGFIYGGAAVYIWSVIPTFYALSYQLLPSPAAVFLFLHLVNYLLVGIVAWLVFSIATDHLKMRPGTAALTAAAVLIQPVFTGQADAINMEIPVAAVCLVVAREFLRGRYWRCCAWSFLALLVKDAATLICLVNLLLAVTVMIVGVGEKAARRRMLVATGLPVLFRFVWVAYIVSQPLRTPMPMGIDVIEVLLQIWFSFPELYIASALCGLGVLVLIRRAVDKGASWRDRVATAVSDPTIAPLVYLIGIWTTYVVFSFSTSLGLIRYGVWYLAFPTLAIFGSLLAAGVRSKTVERVIIVYLMFCVISIDGITRPELDGQWARSGHMLERSREYLADLRSNMRTAAFLEQHADGRPVIVSSPLDRALAIPELGYVSKRLYVFSENMTGLTFTRMGFYQDLNEAGLRAAWYWYRPNILTNITGSELVPGTVAKPVYRDDANGVECFVYELVPAQ